MTQLDPTGDQEIAGSNPAGRQLSFVEIYHEIYILYGHSILPLIQGGQLSVSDEKTCTILVNRTED